MTPKFRPTYWQLESSSMQYILREPKIKETVIDPKHMLKPCPDICCNEECPCLMPTE